MRILYGVQTTGHGHLVRSQPIVRGLRALGHEVQVVFSGPPPDPLWLERIGPPSVVHTGLTFASAAGRIRYLRTVLDARPLRFLADVVGLRPDRYDLVVSDYEPVTAWAARARGVRSVGIGHLYAFAWPGVPRHRGNVLNRLVMDTFAPVAVPAGSHWSTFGAPLLPPTVAPEVRALVRDQVEDDLVLVYLGFEALEDVIPLLRRFSRQRFRVYSRIGSPESHGNVELRPVSRSHFLADLARCRGVIANAGFTLTSECLHMGVSVLVKPLAGQLEQESNAVALAQLGLGSVMGTLDAAAIDRWLGLPAPPPQDYPDVTGALTAWLHEGATEPLAELSRRLWAR